MNSRNVYAVVPTPLYATNYKLWKLCSRPTIAIVGCLVKTLFRICQDVTVYPHQYQLDDLMEKYKDQPIITVSNHMSCLDDPLLWGILLRTRRTLINWEKVRWVPGAHEICFQGNHLKAFVMSLGKTTSCVRGAGVYQPCMEFCVNQLNSNHIVHLFVEGGVNNTTQLGRLKWGVGRLVLDAAAPPIILPFVHRGMESVLPVYHTWPKPFKKVTILIGEPKDTSTLISECKEHNFTRLASRKYITDVIQWELEGLSYQINQL